jgi:DNA repair exonuclease SbcCD nuclease subunit
MTKFLHIADEHIDDTRHGLLNPKTGMNKAVESHAACLLHAVTTAVDQGVEVIISAGDNFKDGRPSAEALKQYVDALAPAARAGLHIHLIDGNHHMTGVPIDHRTSINVVKMMLESIGGKVTVSSEPELTRLPNGFQILSMPWLSKNRVLNTLGLNGLSPVEGDMRVVDYAMDELNRLAAQADQDSPLVLASHVTVDDLRIDDVAAGFSRGSEVDITHLFSEPVLPRKEVEALPFAYGALGHIHTPQQIGEKLFYVGSIDRLTKTDLKDIKGANLVTLDGNKIANVEKIVTPARHMVEVDLQTEDMDRTLDTLNLDSLVFLTLAEGQQDVPREIRDRIENAGALLAKTEQRPRPKVKRESVALPERISPFEALSTWLEHNKAGDVDTEELLSAAAALVEKDGITK